MKTNFSLGIAGFCLFIGCASAGRPFVRANGPSTSGGVSVSLVDQRCARRWWDENSDVLDLEMKVEMTNTGSAPALVVPNELRLLANGYSPAPNATPPEGKSESTSLSAGASVFLYLHFRRVGNARCDQNMQLSLDRVIEEGGGGLNFQPISFTPESTDT